MSTIERAIAIAASAHAGQVDKAGHPYILHPLRVMLGVSGSEARVHDRAPMVLRPSEYQGWLDGGEQADSLLGRAPASEEFSIEPA